MEQVDDAFTDDDDYLSPGQLTEAERREQEGTAFLQAQPDFAFLAGTAGTGKTFRLKEIQTICGDRAVLCATTGIAAINLGEGTTINSLLGYYDTESLVEAFTEGYVLSKLEKLVASGLRLIILDECSMLDGKQLEIIVQAIQIVNGRFANYAAKNTPRLKLLLAGDFCQLPPVNAKFAFEADNEIWQPFENNTTLLTEIRRQTDLAFISALQAVRRGDARSALQYFKSKFQLGLDSEFPGSTILAKNDEVDRFNMLRMSALKTVPEQFVSVREGKQRGEWKNIPINITLKPGCMVMVLANRKSMGTYDFVNGDLGEYLGKVEIRSEGEKNLITEFAKVKLQRTGLEQNIPMIVRENKEATGAKGVKVERYQVVGSIKYMPLRVAYATTVHKSQGLSLDKVQINIASHFWTHPGMMYVALSRARNPDGMRLVGNEKMFVSRCVVSEKVRRYL